MLHIESAVELDDTMEMKVLYNILIEHISERCREKLQVSGCESCAFLPYILIIMDINEWKYNKSYLQNLK